jgi:serpin B
MLDKHAQRMTGSDDNAPERYPRRWRVNITAATSAAIGRSQQRTRRELGAVLMSLFRSSPIRLILSLLALAVATSAATSEPGNAPPKSFALMMLEAAASSSTQGNVAVSPLSVGDALAVAARAADGRTARQFDRLLGMPVHQRPEEAAARLQAAIGDPDGPVVVRSALWVPASLPVSPEFTTKPFDAPVQALPADASGAAEKINAWAASATHGLITDLVDPAMDTSGFVVTNATYFKGSWRTPFNPSATKPRDFYAHGQKPHRVPMMRQGDASVPYWTSGDLEAVRVPFQGGKLEYMIITSRSRASGDQILATLAQSGALETLCQGTGFTVHKGLLEIPKHRVDFGMDLKESLERGGLTMPFAAGADFSSLTDAPVSLGAVRHRAVLLVDETGAEAAAATALLSKRALVVEPTPKLHFVADRPFVGVLLNKDEPAWPLMMTVIRDL